MQEVLIIYDTVLPSDKYLHEAYIHHVLVYVSAFGLNRQLNRNFFALSLQFASSDSRWKKREEIAKMPLTIHRNLYGLKT